MMKWDVLTKLNANMAGGALALVAAVAGYTLFIHGSLTDVLSRETTLAQYRGVRSDVAAKQHACVAEHQQIDDIGEHLAQAQASLRQSRDVGALLGYIAELAKECDVQVGRWQPLGTTKHPEYQVQKFLVEGKADFPAIHRWFVSIETQAAHLDVTNFRIATSAGRFGEACDFECSTRSYTAPEPAPQQVAKGGL